MHQILNAGLFKRLQRNFFLPLQLLLCFLLVSKVQAQQVVPTLTSRVVSMDIDQFSTELRSAPMEGTQTARSAPFVIGLPMPEGGTEDFQVVESPIMRPDFANRYPDFKTYSVEGVANPAKSGRISITPYGFNALIFTPEGVVFIRPTDILDPVDHEVSLTFLGDSILCDVVETAKDIEGRVTSAVGQSITNGGSKRTYSLAIVTTGEFHNDNGGSIAAASAVVMTSVNGIQAIYERELSVNFQLLTPFIYTNPATDPFNPGLDRVVAAAEAVEANFPGGNYDIGHVFHGDDTQAGLGGGGVANLGAVCSNGAEGNGFRKAGGWSGSFDNTSPGWIKLAAHEFGHMFDMPHTFNGTGENCTNNISSVAAYEIGSGTTIMSYQGICGGQNVPGSGTADHYFHANSLERAVNYMNTQACHTGTNTGNNPPVVNANPCGGAYSIPAGTPFRLRGSGTDADGDLIYYAWEQYDEDGPGTPTQGLIGPAAAASTTAPLFRSYPPVPNPERVFPSINLVVANDYTSNYEPLPTVSRTLNFRLTGRDWKAGGGGIHCSNLAINVNAAMGPLMVTSPNGGENLTAGNNTTVNWQINGTNNISGTVNIRLSIDGGFTYPYTLAAGTANDGTEMVMIPAGVSNTNTARIMVESANNTCVVFFDISNANFSITSTCQVATSSVCPITPVNLAAGNPGLNLNMNQYYGGAVTVTNWNVTNASPTGQLANATTPGGQTCQTVWGVEKYAEFDFAVDAAGSYTLTRTNSVFAVMSVFIANGYNPASPCNGTFLGSNSNGPNLSTGASVTVNLNPCTVYKAVVWTTNNENGNGTISIAGPGTIYGAGAGPGVGYSYTYVAVNNANNQVAAVSAAANFTNLPGGSYLVYGASYYSGAGPNPATVNPANWVGQSTTQVLSGGSCVLFSTNSRNVTVTGGGGCTPPTVNMPTITQPTCNTPTGTIVVNATGTGTLEYSINGGTNYQVSNTFTNQPPGNYNITVRLLGDANCISNYAQNPVTLNVPTGCGGGNCTDYMATGLQINIPDNTPAGVISTINVPTGGTITDVNIKNLKGTHQYLGALRFTLTSPNGTVVTLINQACNDNNLTTNFDISLDDQAQITTIPCPYNTGVTVQPQNPLSAFNGQNPSGNWILNVSDNDGFNDVGQLNEWTLEICVSGGVPCPQTLAVNDMNIASGTYQAANQLTSSGMIGQGNNVTFRAGNNVDLQPNFTVPITSIFEARIGGCQ